MERITVRCPEAQVELVDELVDEGRFPNRSEAVRHAVRSMLDDEVDTTPRREIRADGGVR